MILKAFLDVGVTLNSDRQVYERNNVLVGSGVGAELSLSRHLGARMDFGWALQDAKTTNGRVVNDVGDFRVNFLVTVVF